MIRVLLITLGVVGAGGLVTWLVIAAMEDPVARINRQCAEQFRGDAVEECKLRLMTRLLAERQGRKLDAAFSGVR